MQDDSSLGLLLQTLNMSAGSQLLICHPKRYIKIFLQKIRKLQESYQIHAPHEIPPSRNHIFSTGFLHFGVPHAEYLAGTTQENSAMSRRPEVRELCKQLVGQPGGEIAQLTMLVALGSFLG